MDFAPQKAYRDLSPTDTKNPLRTFTKIFKKEENPDQNPKKEKKLAGFIGLSKKTKEQQEIVP